MIVMSFPALICETSDRDPDRTLDRSGDAKLKVSWWSMQPPRRRVVLTVSPND
jgi:hypothetical protein